MIEFLRRMLGIDERWHRGAKNDILWIEPKTNTMTVYFCPMRKICSPCTTKVLKVNWLTRLLLPQMPTAHVTRTEPSRCISTGAESDVKYDAAEEVPWT